MSNSNNDNFTATEARALFESLQSSIQVIAEDQRTMRQDISTIKEDVNQLKFDMTVVKDAIRISIPSLSDRVTALETFRK